MAIYVCGKKTGELTQIAGISKFPADYGTRAEFEAKKDDLPDGTVFTTIDEFIESIRFITGEIKTYAGIIDDTHPTPTGWLLCDGREVSKATYSSLYAVIGDSYGVASDTTKFKLPSEDDIAESCYVDYDNAKDKAKQYVANTWHTVTENGMLWIRSSIDRNGDGRIRIGNASDYQELAISGISGTMYSEGSNSIPIRKGQSFYLVNTNYGTSATFIPTLNINKHLIRY